MTEVGFRFRRTIEFFPGIRINLGKRHVSTSIGVRGAHVTIGHDNIRETVGFPGSGVSYTHVERAHEKPTGDQPPVEVPKGRAWRGWVWIVFVMLIIIVLLGWNSPAKAGLQNCWGSGSQFAQCAATWERVFNNDSHMENVRTTWEVGSFESFVMGVADAELQRAWCSRGDLDADTIIAVVAKYVREHPEEWGKLPNAIVAIALSVQFPCKPKKNRDRSASR